MALTHVPTLDLREFEADKAGFTRKVGEAYETFGFCCFTGHGVSPDLIKKAYQIFEAFFYAPLDMKMKTHLPGTAGVRGYTPFKVETAKTSQLADLKEFYHVGRDISKHNPYPEIFTANVWPENSPEFEETCLDLYNSLEEVGRQILKPLALHLKLEEDAFIKITSNGNSILRALHYPPVDPKDLPAVRAEAHEDICFITLLIGATQAGLELLKPDGAWLPITTHGDAIVVNIGDMLQRLSNHKFPSTTHRVINPEGEAAKKSRFSMPFFMDPDPDYLIQTLPSCIDEKHPDRYKNKAITAHDYLMERLAEIKLK